MAAARENLPPQVIQRVAREIRQLVLQPLDGIRYMPQEDETLTEIHVEIDGPVNTPYEGGFFHIKLVLSDQFPHVPPKGLFRTKIFHPNIATNGDICVNTLKKDWSPDYGIAHVLQVIRCLLIVPFPESSLNDEAGKLFMDSYDEYARRARIWTSIHAARASAVKKPNSDKNTDAAGSAATAAASTGDQQGNEHPEQQQPQEMTTSETKKRASASSGNSPVATLKKKSTTKRKSLKRL